MQCLKYLAESEVRNCLNGNEGLALGSQVRSMELIKINNILFVLSNSWPDCKRLLIFFTLQM